MNRQPKATAVKQDAKPTLTPKLRFPAFRDAPGWEMKKIGSMLIETPRPIDLGDETEYRLVTVKRRYGGLVSRGILKGKEIKVKSQFLVKAGDFLISKRQIVHDACGLVTKDLHDSVVSNEYSVLIPRAGCDVVFFNWFAKQPCVSKSFLECSVGIVIEKMLFKLSTWQKREFLFPDLAEQQKIAECLTSLDEVIAAQSQKLDALKTHKKGLMQQLFPREGETLPRLRFPEFRDDWKMARIGDFIDSYKGGASLTPSDFVPYSNYEVIPKKAISAGVWLKIDTEKPTYCKEFFFKENLQAVVDNTYLITTLRDLVPSGPSIGYIVKFASDKTFILAQGVYGLKPKKTIIPDFLIHFSNTGRYRKMMQSVMVGSTQVHIRNSVYLNLPMSVPRLDEQQKIANCLTSLDDLITAQSDKLVALKTHKKGLMQQLFPSPEEVEA